MLFDKKIIGCAAIVALSGCVDQSFFVKQNVTFDRYERDTVRCHTQAAQAVPTNTQVGWAPYVGLYSADTNLGLRQSNIEICMRDQGYQQVSIPYCSGDEAKRASEQAKHVRDRNSRMRIAANSCYITTNSGELFLYTP